jgi:hypothetical protein
VLREPKQSTCRSHCRPLLRVQFDLTKSLLNPGPQPVQPRNCPSDRSRLSPERCGVGIFIVAISCRYSEFRRDELLRSSNARRALPDAARCAICRLTGLSPPARPGCKGVPPLPMPVLRAAPH